MSPANVETMFYVKATEKDIPWHGQGTPLPKVATAKQAMKAAGLNWTVSLQPVYAKVGGKYLPVENRRAVVRDMASNELEETD